MSTLSPGVRLSDRFTLRTVVGVGGMAEVWRADDALLGRPVAVKVLSSALAGDPAFSGAAYSEARAAARLAHPHVTQIHDYGETMLPDGTVLTYLVMELIEGQSLADRLVNGPLPWREAVAVASQVASALAAGHRLGIVHRDIKPANIMLTAAGVKVVDFGIATREGSPPGPGGGRLVGTPAYAAPERLRTETATPSSDVYALGAVLYEALTGWPPIDAADWREAAAAHDAGAPIAQPDVAGLPRRIRLRCMACLAADPHERPTAAELAHDLADAVGQPALATVPPSLAETGAATSGDPSPTMVAGPMGNFVAGRARLPHPPTMIDSSAAYAPEAPPPGYAYVPAPRGRLIRSPLALAAGAVLILAVAAFVLAGVLSSSDPGTVAAPPAGSSSPTASAPPAPSATPSTAPTVATGGSPQAIVDQLSAAIDSAEAAGLIDHDAAESLSDKVDDLQDSLSGRHGNGRSGRVREQAAELRHTIDNLADDGKIDRQTATQLDAIIAPLSNFSSSDDGGDGGGNGGRQ